MNAQSSCQLPYSLDGIQLWTIGREKIENNITLVLFDPGFKQPGIVISTVIENDMNYPLAACSLDVVDSGNYDPLHSGNYGRSDKETKP